MKKILLSMIAVCFISLLAQANIIYVKIAPGGNNDGTSWANAYGSAESAIEGASAGDSVFVAEGIYASNSIISIPQDVSVFGGFPYGGNPTFADRDWVAYPTIFSGDVLQNDIPDELTNRSDNAVRIFETYTMYVLDGVIVEHGGNGGNSAGAGLAQAGVNRKEGIIRNCIFRQNLTNSNAGAIRALTLNVNDTLLIENTIIHNNGAVNGVGGAIVSNGGTIIMNNCKVVNNFARIGASAIFASCENYNSIIECNNVLFAKNQSLFGRLFRVDFDGTSNTNHAVFSNCTFVKNEVPTMSHGLFTAVSSFSTPASSIHFYNSILEFGELSSQTMFDNMSGYDISLSEVVSNIPSSDFETCTASLPSYSYYNEYFETDVTWAIEDSTTKYEYILDCNSFGIDAGDPLIYEGGNTDLANNPRVSGSAIDYGAFETQFGQSPAISQVGSVLYSDFAHDYYQWHLDGVPIVGAHADSLETTQNGDYTLTVVDANTHCIVDSVSNTITIQESGVGLEEQTMNNLTVYPNPVKDVLHLNHQDGIIKVYSAAGQLIVQSEEKLTQLNVSALKPGIYLLQLEGDKGTISTRFIKE